MSLNSGFGSVTEALVLILVTVFFGWYLYFQYCVSYWKKKGVPTIPPSFPAGNVGESFLGSANLFVHLKDLYNKFKEAGHEHGGIYFFNGPVYMPIDPALIKRIFISDFEHFIDRGIIHDEKNFPLTANLFSQTGKEWKDLRAKFSPSFTSGKLKTMYASVFMKNADKLMKVLEPIAQSRGEISAKKYFSMFTADMIVTTTLGFELDILNNPDQEITRIIKNLTNRPLKIKLKTFLTDGLSRPGNLFKSAFDNKEAEEYLESAIRQTIKFRKDNGIVVHDFFDELMKIEGLSWTEILGHAFVMFVAGYDTTSTNISTCLHLLAHHQDVQDRLRQEIHTNLGKDFRQFTYDGVTQLSYLDKVLKEVLRLIPPAAALFRECVKEYPVPGTDVVLDKGTPVIIPLLGLHWDPEYFPDPMKFDPSRFDEEVVPFTYLPFGEGRRICIAMRQALLITKLGVASVISKFKVLPSKRTPREPGFERIPSSGLLVLNSELFIRLEPL